MKFQNYNVKYCLNSFVAEIINFLDKSSKGQFVPWTYANSWNYLNYKKRESLGVSICLNMVSIETLDLDTEKKSVSTVEIFDGRENLDSFKKLVSTIEISRSRSRYLDFVSTRPKSPKSPKSLDRDREICRDMTFLASLDAKDVLDLDLDLSRRRDHQA